MGNSVTKRWKEMVEQRLLMVDDEENVRRAIYRLCRKENYQVLLAASGEEALQILQHNPVSVILSDQRMPGMAGIELLQQVKVLYPDVIRMMISGYTALESLTDAVNEGAIFKFVFKPWDDQHLLNLINEAFAIHDLRQRNLALTEELKSLNANLEKRVKQKTRSLEIHVRSLKVSHDIFDCLPYIGLGISDEGIIVGANRFAKAVLKNEVLVGLTTDVALPVELFSAFTNWKQKHPDLGNTNISEKQNIKIGQSMYRINFAQFATAEGAHGYLISGGEMCEACY